MVMFFGARTPEELPYFGPLQKVPETLLEKHLVYSRLAGQSKEYVQDRMRGKSERIAALLESTRTHVYICGLKGMEHGVEDAFVEICRSRGLDWKALKPPMRAAGRYHVETY
jgi:benzoyl-CoA 2,3-dioxygenase component A